MPLKGKNDNCIGLLSIYQDNSIPSSIDNSLIAEIAKIAEHSLQAHIEFYMLKSNIKLLTNLVSHLPVGVILCNDNFHILHINQLAKGYIDLFHENTSPDEADRVMQNYLLAAFIDSGENEYSVPVGEYKLQLAIRIHTTKDMEKGNYTTFYEITITCANVTNEKRWKEFLKNKALSTRECEITEFLRLGYTNNEIADNLHISINTIKRHRENIYRKLNIKRINQLNVLYENIRNK